MQSLETEKNLVSLADLENGYGYLLEQPSFKLLGKFLTNIKVDNANFDSIYDHIDEPLNMVQFFQKDDKKRARLLEAVSYCSEELTKLEEMADNCKEEGLIAFKLIKRKISLKRNTINTYKTLFQIKKYTAKGDRNTALKLSKQLQKMYEESYGKYSPKELQDNLNQSWVRERFERIKVDNPQLWDKISVRIEPYIKSVEPINDKIDISEFYEFSKLVLRPFLDVVPEKYSLTVHNPEEKITSGVAKEISQHILDMIPNSEGWKAVVEEGRKGAMVQPKTKEVILPDKEQEWKKWMGTIFHENLVHAIRSINESRNDVITLPNYLDFEEGLASAIQYIVTGTYNISIGKKTPYPLVITLVEIGFDFGEIKEILWESSDKKESDEKLIHKLIMRVSRGAIGGSFEENGVEVKSYFPKDKAYSIGLQRFHKMIKVWNQTENTHLKDAIRIILENIFEAKFDPTQPDHIMYMLEKEIFELTSEQRKAYFEFLDNQF